MCLFCVSQTTKSWNLLMVMSSLDLLMFFQKKIQSGIFSRKGHFLQKGNINIFLKYDEKTFDFATRWFSVEGRGTCKIIFIPKHQNIYDPKECFSRLFAKFGAKAMNTLWLFRKFYCWQQFSFTVEICRKKMVFDMMKHPVENVYFWFYSAIEK